MKVLVTGSNGQLGFEVITELKKLGIEYKSTDRTDLDITDEYCVKKIIGDYLPDVIIHCAAYTSVDKAEDQKEECFRVNVLGTRYIAEACKQINAKLIYISTDYVFDGNGDSPFEVSDQPDPVNFYGLTKYEGELEVQKALSKYFIVRISWVFGSHGNNFVSTMLNLGRDRSNLSVVSDQIGSPTYTYDLVQLLLRMLDSDYYGIYHATNEGFCSWFDFASEIFRITDNQIDIKPIKSENYKTRAKRPLNSRLSKREIQAVFDFTLPSWEDALKRYITNQYLNA